MAPRRALQPDVVAELVRRYVEDECTATLLAREYGVDVSTACRYLRLAGVSRDAARRGGKPHGRAALVCTQCGAPPPLKQGKCKPCLARYHRSYHLRKQYGITIGEYERIMEQQGGCCAICRREGRLVVDHDHSCCSGKRTCGKCVRGLLCFRCNYGIGYLGEGNLIAAVSYVAGGAARDS